VEQATSERAESKSTEKCRWKLLDDLVANFNENRAISFLRPTLLCQEVHELLVWKREAIGSTMVFHNALQSIASPRTAAKSRTLHVVAAKSC
jgi:hypothetical protein